MRPNRFHLAASSLILVVGLAGCAPQPTTPIEESACQARAVLEVSLTAFLSLDPTTAAPGDYTLAWSAVRQDYLDLQDYLGQMAYEHKDAIDQAVDDLGQAVDDLPNDASPADAAAALQPEIDAVKAAFDELDGSLDCGTP
jgi:hypothetical protein